MKYFLLPNEAQVFRDAGVPEQYIEDVPLDFPTTKGNNMARHGIFDKTMMALGAASAAMIGTTAIKAVAAPEPKAAPNRRRKKGKVKAAPRGRGMRSRYMPHQGKQEMARRRRQMGVE